MREPHSLVLDGHTYTVTQLGAVRALRLLTRLARMTGGGLARAAAAAASALGGKGGLGDIDVDLLGSAADALFANANEDDVEKTVRELLELAMVDERPLAKDIDTHFRGRVLALMKVVKFALEVNYADFFGELQAAYAGLATAKAIEPSSPSTTT